MSARVCVFDQNSLPTACIYFTFIHFYLSFHLVLRSNVTVHDFKIELSRAYSIEANIEIHSMRVFYKTLSWFYRYKIILKIDTNTIII